MLKKLKQIAVGGVLTLGMMNIGYAQLQSSLVANDSLIAPPQLDKLIEQNIVTVIETFTHESLTGWLVESNGEYHLYWETPGGYVVAGPMIDRQGYNITARFLEQKKPTPNYDQAYEALISGEGYFSTQKDASGGELWVFVEPFCGWCSKMHKELQPFIAAGLKVNWVPVSFLSQRSPDVVEYIMNADDPATAYDLFEMYKNTDEALQFTSKATRKTQVLLNTNSDLMNEFGIEGTPGLVYRVNGKVMTGGYMNNAKLRALTKQISASYEKQNRS